MNVHRTAARGFDVAAGAYARGRPDYPGAAVELLVQELGARRVLDLGAGTGKLTKQLVERGVECIAVEPVEGMRARFADDLPDVECLDGTAEAIPLPDGSVAALVVAQAFHWFRHDEALAEMHRVLEADGRFALVWNIRDESEPWVARITEIIRPYEGADGVKIPRHREGAWRAPLDASTLFEHVTTRSFHHTQQMDPPGLMERIASTSFIAVLPDEERARVLEQVHALTDEPPLAGRASFEFPYITEVDVYRRRS